MTTNKGWEAWLVAVLALVLFVGVFAHQQAKNEISSLRRQLETATEAKERNAASRDELQRAYHDVIHEFAACSAELRDTRYHLHNFIEITGNCVQFGNEVDHGQSETAPSR